MADEPFDVVRPSGRRLPGVVTRPHPREQDESTSGDAVLLLHGLFSHHDHNFAPALAARLASELRLTVLRFSFRYGADPTEPNYRFAFPGFADDVDDVHAAVATLAAAGLRVVAVVGHSKGANVALMVAPDLPAVRCVAALAPRYRMHAMLDALFAAELPQLEAADSFEWTPRGGGGAIVVTRSTCAAVRAIDMGAVADVLPTGMAVLVAHGTTDRVIPHVDADALRERRPSARVLKLRCGHTFKEAQPALLDAVVRFVGEHCCGGVAVAVPTPGGPAAKRGAVRAAGGLSTTLPAAAISAPPRGASRDAAAFAALCATVTEAAGAARYAALAVMMGQ